MLFANVESNPRFFAVNSGSNGSDDPAKAPAPSEETDVVKSSRTEVSITVSRSKSKPSGIFFDALYDPWPTEFAHSWKQAGGKIVGGLELLIAQGVEQVKFFTGEQVPTDELTIFLRNEFAI